MLRMLRLVFLAGYLTTTVFGEDTNWVELVKKAESGDRIAQCNLGYKYDKGDGITKDSVAAARWYLLSLIHI